MAKAGVFRSPRGARDILPPESGRFFALVQEFAQLCRLAGYGQVLSPIFEELGVFLRLGESTDVVTKEMYDFFDKDGRQMALRPELTASIVRAYLQHRPSTPWKVWYEGPQFRYEKPQAGRYRQFSQVGVEMLGTDDPHADVEVIALAARFYDELGLRRLTLHLNSLGDDECGPRYVDALRTYLASRRDELSEQSQVTLETNPLRVLDSKRGADATIVAEAPTMVEYLNTECAEHFEAVTAGLERLGIDYTISPRLVRGLDYYTKTTFEFASDALEGAQNAVGGGGRYDGLAEALGGQRTPGIGFALGVERILLACDAESTFEGPAGGVTVFVIDVVGGGEALEICVELRDAGIGADRAFDGRSMKAQMRAADRSGAPIAVIVGDTELADHAVTVRDLRGDTGQRLVPRDRMIAVVKEMST